MNDKIVKFLIDTIIHKQYVLESCDILSEYLISNNQCDLALQLLKRCAIHDDSKFKYEEIISFISIPDNNGGMKNPNIVMDDYTKKALSIHWKNNRHHPEYYDDPRNMSELDILEMACDCHSRSLQYNTNLLEFIDIRQKYRFKLPENIYKKYRNYCVILVSEYEKYKETPKIKRKLEDK